MICYGSGIMPTIAQKTARRVAAGEFGERHTKMARAISERETVSEGHGKGLNLSRPAGWPELPATASLEVEVEWVYGVYERVVRRREGKRNLIVLGRARGVAPSEGALGLLVRASEHPTWFYGLVAKVRGEGEEVGGERERGERKRLEDVRGLIEQYVERARGEAVALRG